MRRRRERERIAQDSTNLADSKERLISTCYRFSLNGTYELPFEGNRWKDGWQLTGVRGSMGSPEHHHEHRRHVGHLAQV